MTVRTRQLELARKDGESENRIQLLNGWNRLMVSRRIPPGGYTW
ncbi:MULTISPECIES: hypothetical protein [Streptomyces]|uniref:Uncharacterized protein n=1 Tax=Streptomyces avermitilis TaxID=33903 RepID=A0A4D4MWE6_STRAX|nr:MULTISPECIES: hypothetical protein [Streptomyces]BBJ51314.1 hypothetical protein SAVMC3_39430 [Streptomyces avermitilis]GDY76508.1 hypothetical protein SAV31267_059930 [Streptomyces avermitilis]